MKSAISIVHTTSDFNKSFRRLSPNLAKLAVTRDSWFRANPFDARLKTHKLKGELKGYFAYSVNYEYRVLFRFIHAREVIYYDIGTHRIYG